MFFNKNINFLVKNTKINQNQLAKSMGITRQSVNQIMQTKDPRISTLLKISEIYNLSIDDLIKKDLEDEYKKGDFKWISLKILKI